MNNLQRIALGERDLGKRRSRHDRAVALDRDLLHIKPQRRDEIGNAALAHLPWFAVQNDRNHVGVRLALPFAEQPI